MCTLILTMALFIIPSSSGEMVGSVGKILGNGNEAWSLVLLGAGLVGFGLRGFRKTGK